MVTYQATTEELYDSDIGFYTAYGILALAPDEPACPGCCFRDVFHSRDEADRFADLCNRLKLSPLHLRDAVEDATPGYAGAVIKQKIARPGSPVGRYFFTYSSSERPCS